MDSIPRKTKAFVLSDSTPHPIHHQNQLMDPSQKKVLDIFLCTFANWENELSPAEKKEHENAKPPKLRGLMLAGDPQNSITSPEIKHIFQIRDITTPEFATRKTTEKKKKSHDGITGRKGIATNNP